MLNKKQIQILQIAVRAAGIRGKGFEGSYSRYRLLLGQYTGQDGSAVISCTQLNNSQLDDILAICESLGFRARGKDANHYRLKAAMKNSIASFAQQAAIKNLAGDLGWNEYQLNGFIKRMTQGQVDCVISISPGQAWRIIEALKNMLSRETGRSYKNVTEIKDEFTEATDGKEKTRQIG